MSEDVLLVENVPVEGSSPAGGVISVWTLNRPEKLNALNSASHDALRQACANAEADDAVRVVVILDEVGFGLIILLLLIFEAFRISLLGFEFKIQELIASQIIDFSSFIQRILKINYELQSIRMRRPKP